VNKPLAVVLVLLSGACARKPATAASPMAEHGRLLYIKLCATCHGERGQGYVADNAPSLRNAGFLATANDEFLRVGIERGRPGTAMAGYARSVGGPLAPGDADAIIAWLREGGPARLALAPEPIAGDTKKGKAIYDSQCMQCHGTATRRVNAVHLANPVLLATASDAFLRYAVEAGRPGTLMLGWKGRLAPKQIDDVVAYVRSMAVAPGVPAAVPAAMAGPAPPPPREGPVVLNPRGKHAEFTLKDDRLVSLDQVKAALDQKRRLVIVDARPPSDWLNLHIPGSISAPYYEPKSLDDIPNDGTWVVAYCACPHHASGEVVDQLRKRGYKHTAVLDEGIFAWQHKGYPVVTAPGMLPTPAPPPPPTAAAAAVKAPH
jgi:cytochrome c oxidase cbb3-type subunit 3/ubiquinol-cytochrome c reductase cytochrome c subunit